MRPHGSAGRSAVCDYGRCGVRITRGGILLRVDRVRLGTTRSPEPVTQRRNFGPSTLGK